MKIHAAPHFFICCAICYSVPLTVAGFARAQQLHQWTPRENLGYKGEVRSGRTAVLRINEDPRPETRRKLYPEKHSDWNVFDQAGRVIESVGSSRGDQILSIVKCSFAQDGTGTCEDSAGGRSERRQQSSILPDGAREEKNLRDSRLESRDVTRFDLEGKQVSRQHFGASGILSSEELNLPGGDRWKVYDDRGAIRLDMKTLSSKEKNRLERWFYKPDGQPFANLVVGKDGELLYLWYEIGYKPAGAPLYSLGTCQPGLCVDYTFEEDGSGRFEKVVEHTHEAGNLEPDSEEHYGPDGALDEKVALKYSRDDHGNWTSRSVFVWDLRINVPVEIERDTRTLTYFP